MPLEDYEATPGVVVGLCPHCRGLFLDRDEIRKLVGRGSLADATEIVPLMLGEEVMMRCPTCVDPAMQPLSLKAPETGELWQCRDCAGLWLPEGAFFALANALTKLRSAAEELAATCVSETVHSERTRRLAHSRSRFDVGLENLIGVPLVLLLSYLFSATLLGRMLASLVGMPFHELGHAAASWLSSRIAIPLPFFTVWYDDQSILMGLVVASALTWLGYHAHQERNRFGLATAVLLLTIQAVFTLALPARLTLMWQILSGALGELLFGAFLLVAFHFPLPDRLRWDFWRWVAIIPGALCFTHAMRLWRTVVSDVSQMPWGSAIGSDSDGDMNRLVQQFGWGANELAEFYLRNGYLCMAAIAGAYAYAIWRHYEKRTVPFSKGLRRGEVQPAPGEKGTVP